MWRTGVTLLLVSLAVASAVETVENLALDNAHFVSGLAAKDKGPIRARVVHGESESLVADIPEVQVQGIKPEEPKKEEESTFSHALRVIRSNVLPKTLNAVGLGNRFADQKTFTIPTSGKTINLVFGNTAPVTVATQFSLSDDVVFVYGKNKCTGKLCKNTEVKNTFDETKSTIDTASGKFSYNRQGGSASGDNYKDKVTLVKDMDFAYVFGVANAGSNDKDIVDSPAEGYVGFGFEKAANFEYKTVKTVLNSVAPSRALTIWQNADLKSGVIYLGDVTYDKCPGKKTELQEARKNKAGVQQWWFKAGKIEAGDKSVPDPIVQITVDFDTIGVPKDLYDAITGKLDKNMVDDPKKLPTIKLTVGKDVIVLDGSAYTKKVEDKKYLASISSTENLEYQVSLGWQFFSSACVTLKQNDDSGNAFQIGLIYGDPKSSASGMSLAIAPLIMLPLIYVMGL